MDINSLTKGIVTLLGLAEKGCLCAAYWLHKLRAGICDASTAVTGVLTDRTNCRGMCVVRLTDQQLSEAEEKAWLGKPATHEGGA